MFKKLIVGAVFAGLAAGVLAALLELTFVVPLIAQGEQYESGDLTYFAVSDAGAAAGHDHASHDHGASMAADSPLLMPRALGTVGMFLASYTGFALVMVAGFALAERAGATITARSGVIWGLMGFLAVQLAPAFGLPPELPGSTGAPLEVRQLWWAGCVAASVGGIALLAFGRSAIMLGAGAVMLALPHLIGAPLADPSGVVPPDLAAQFTARALGTGAASWALLGTIAGAIWARDV